MCDNVHMISSQRQHLILNRLRTRGAVRITALSKELGVSAMTIRRDIADLADKGLLKRVHGGAVTTSSLLAEPLFSVKSQMDMGLKDTIARRAISYVSPGDVIAIGGGTTAYVFAQHLLESRRSEGITILTNSIPVAELVQAMESKEVEVIVTGGVITRSNSLVGPIADKVVASLRVNTVFLGTHSVSIPRGFLMPNSLEAATDMALMDIADRTIILTDHTKWSCTSLSLFASFDQVSTVVTDDGLDPAAADETRALVRELVLASTGGGEADTAPGPLAQE
ncbi:DeoR/GlpR family DNA-binding transcription regulator [Bifidobacterium actinocoloniiforme]|uniref:DeoR/GlpR family DNA-binding transcription regulator n=1 Tax=Bifidobacterium actinocoloniiforme TaxID=638619 RepID=UPI00187DA55D|nr:DeoR/GlpR family DNA-binding transcription regulator [Bifidobacterium actinocoloniiforme]